VTLSAFGYTGNPVLDIFNNDFGANEAIFYVSDGKIENWALVDINFNRAIYSYNGHIGLPGAPNELDGFQLYGPPDGSNIVADPPHFVLTLASTPSAPPGALTVKRATEVVPVVCAKIPLR
jgi:hypothetical protein